MLLQRSGPRKYLKNGRNEQEYDVSHFIGWQVLWMKGEFKTTLRVKQNRHKGLVAFKLLQSDIMERFEGSWALHPFTQSAMQKVIGKPTFDPLAGMKGATLLDLLHTASVHITVDPVTSKQLVACPSLCVKSRFTPTKCTGLADFWASKTERKCLVVFEQNVLPKGVPPRLKGLARRIAASAMKRTLDDIDDEAQRIHKGESRIPSLNHFAHTKKEPLAPAASASATQANTPQPKARFGQSWRRRQRCEHDGADTPDPASEQAAGDEKQQQTRHSKRCTTGLLAAGRTASVTAAAGQARRSNAEDQAERQARARRCWKCAKSDDFGLWRASLPNSINL